LSDQPSALREAFRTDTARGKLAVVTAALVIVTPILATFVSRVFLVLLVVALVLSLVSVARAGSGSAGPSRPLARAGYAMAVNGVLLIIALFLTGIIGDFFVAPREGVVTSAIGAGFTTVHILLAIGLILVDDHRHARRADI
jgi:hypothetical protein